MPPTPCSETYLPGQEARAMLEVAVTMPCSSYKVFYPRNAK